MAAEDLYAEEHFDRASALERILERFASTQCVCLIGPRQVGKTTLALEMKDAVDSAIYLNVYNEEDAERLKRASEVLRENDQVLLIIDEVQALPNLFPALQVEIDRREKEGVALGGRVLLLGSASEKIVELLQPLMGRHARVELTALHLLEIQPDDLVESITPGIPQGPELTDATSAIRQPEISRDAQVRMVWLRGGMPKSLCASNDAQSYQWRCDYLEDYFARNLEVMGVDFDGETFRRLWQLLAARQGSLWDAAHCAKILGIKVEVLRRYLAAMKQLGFVRELTPWFRNTEKTLEKLPKLFLRDSGLLHAITNVSDFASLDEHAVSGHSWEGFVIEQAALSCPQARSLHFYRDSKKHEIDLVIDFSDTEVWAIEIKREDSPQPNIGNHVAASVVGASRKVIIKPGGEPANLDNGFEVRPLLDFCREAEAHFA